jgi:hypothetical protein
MPIEWDRRDRAGFHFFGSPPAAGSYLSPENSRAGSLCYFAANGIAPDTSGIHQTPER